MNTKLLLSAIFFSAACFQPARESLAPFTYGMHGIAYRNPYFQSMQKKGRVIDLDFSKVMMCLIRWLCIMHLKTGWRQTYIIPKVYR